MARFPGALMVVSILYIICLVSIVNGTGKFFVGLLSYDNTGNLAYNGSCCDGVKDVNGSCVEFCDLVFDIKVYGLDRSSHKQRPSNKPISDKANISFTSPYGGNSPMSFAFTRWPDEVNITVDVYDKDGDQEILVDQFHTTFFRQGSALYYIRKPLKGLRPENASSITILLRYQCDKTKGPRCFTDCMDHTDDDVCPVTSPTGTDITYIQAFTDPSCSQLYNGTSPNNCSSQMTTELTTQDSSKNITSSTKRPFMDSGTSVNVTNSGGSLNQNTTKSDLNSSQITTQPYVSIHSSTSSSGTKTNIQFTRNETSSTTTSTSNDVRINDIITTQKPSSQLSSMTPTGGASMPTPPSDKIKDTGMTYWPAIVGGVLGGLALAAAAGFLLYYKRQKKLQKRQEIYNVNPKILRQFEDYAENGTSGRADVPLETEQF